MSETTKCPTCGATARVDRRNLTAAGEPRLTAVSDEEAGKKIEQLKRALGSLRERLDVVEWLTRCISKLV